MDQTTTTLLMFLALIVGGYLLIIRPQQKRAKEQQDMIARLVEGSRVMLTSGVFGTIRHLGTKQAIVEVSPGVELTILRQAIVRTIPAEEEEFEYDDSDDAVDESTDDVDSVPDDLTGLPEADRSPWQRDADAADDQPESPSDTDKR
jgi:preprotein translocase subunit YajC